MRLHGISKQKSIDFPFFAPIHIRIDRPKPLQIWLTPLIALEAN